MSKDIIYIEEYIASLPIPGDSPSISGVYLEQIIPGYRTNETTGRWSLRSALDETNRSGDWSRVKLKRYEPKDFVISYSITCNSPQNLHDATRKLRSFLHQKKEEFKVIFRDEETIFYTGIVSDISAQRLVNRSSVSGSFTIHCADGRGYSTKEYEVTSENKEGITVFDFEYNGTVEAYPILEATTKNSSGTGFVGFLTEEGKIIQIGDPTAELNSNKLIIAKSFKNADTSGWIRNGYSLKPNGTERTFSSSGTVKASGNGFTIDSAGTGTNNHGPCLSFDFSSNDAQNFTAELTYNLNMNRGATNAAGGIEFAIMGHDNGSNVEYEIARISIYKKDNKTSTARIDFWVDGKIVDYKEFKMDDPNSNFYTGSSLKINN